MKLRNKKTGEAVYVDFQIPICNNDETLGSYSVTSLEALNRSFEDYKPKEPLIKDKKIRKAVRAWAEANEREYLLVIKSGGRLEVSDGSPHLIYISFNADNDTLESLDDRTYYPIAELCGEEE